MEIGPDAVSANVKKAFVLQEIIRDGRNKKQK